MLVTNNGSSSWNGPTVVLPNRHPVTADPYLVICSQMLIKQFLKSESLIDSLIRELDAINPSTKTDSLVRSSNRLLKFENLNNPNYSSLTVNAQYIGYLYRDRSGVTWRQSQFDSSCPPAKSCLALAHSTGLRSASRRRTHDACRRSAVF